VKQADARFAGSIPETYDTHLGPLFFEPYAADLAARLARLELPTAQGSRVLEIAAGTGILTRRLRQALPPAVTLVATDLNEPMLEVARRRLGSVPGIEWRQADATALPFPDRTFDAVVCQFGLMFVPDKTLAAREVFRVLRPGRRFLFNVWGSLEENPLGRIAHEAVASFFPADPPGFYLVPFGLHDTAAIAAILAGAGFEEIEVSTVGLRAEAPSAEHAAVGLVRGSPILNAIEERGSAKPETIIAAVAAGLAGAYGEGPLRVPMQAHVISALRSR
jgi:SAM-dependent methyltransferase